MNKIEQIYRILCENGFRVTTDTRKIALGDVFFALKGENFDGNDFVLFVLFEGAAGVVTDDPSRYTDTEQVIVV